MRRRIIIWVLIMIILITACNLGQVIKPTSELPTPKVPLADSTEIVVDTTATIPTPEAPSRVAEAGESLVTYVFSEGIGDIAVQVSLPDTPRYEDGAGVIVDIATFFTEARRFHLSLDVTQIGMIHISYLWPGKSDPSGARSEGTYDYGGEDSIRALRDVIRFASGQITDRDGYYLDDLIAMTPLTDQVGLYAFSHPGIAAVNVLALCGDELPNVGYLVGRENPTQDAISSVELGYWDEDNRPVVNPLYVYPGSYTPTEIVIDYSAVRWDPTYTQPGWDYVGRAYLDLNGNGALDVTDFNFGPRIPTMYEKRYYSVALTRALLESGALSESIWPEDLATPEEARETWPFRTSVHRYPELASLTPNLKVMLVFADRDHVQPSLDKPHIHQAYDGFRHAAGLWTRLNPDLAYVAWVDAELVATSPDNPANTEPGDWMDIRSWSYRDIRNASKLVPLAAVAEMADRLHEGVWDDDLGEIIIDFPAPTSHP